MGWNGEDVYIGFFGTTIAFGARCAAGASVALEALEVGLQISELGGLNLDAG